METEARNGYLTLLELEIGKRREARRTFHCFLDFISPDYERQWFHTLIADKIQNLIDGKSDKKKLAIFMPPQHGKSEVVSRKAPAWILGNCPDTRMVGVSYSSDLAQQFSRAIQRLMCSDEYGRLFPDVKLDRQAKGYQRNADFFEIPGHTGFYKAVGVGGSLTGTPADVGIIDDPIKDAMEAYSLTYRERIWNWYTDVFLTRLHNDSRQILIQTRWHEDDLAGRILEREGDSWDIVSLPAIRTDGRDPDDIRRIGEALWEERHSLSSLEEIKARSPRTYASLYDQNPTVQGGNIVKKDWFGHISERDFRRTRGDEPIDFFLDTAYTEKTENDPSGIIAVCFLNGKLFVTHAKKVNMKFPDLIRFLPEYVSAHGYDPRSSVRIEPKANGLSVIDQLKECTRLNVMKTPSPTESKETRLNAVSSIVEGGRVVLVDDVWTEDFTDEVCGFPARPHDEYVDVLVYAINHFFASSFRPIDKKKLYNVVY